MGWFTSVASPFFIFSAILLMLKKIIQKFILVNKKEGETPLECLTDFRNKNKAYKDIKMTYAGRLDPMASGLLLIVAGEEIKNKEKYLKLDKAYEFEVLFGFATDTYDIMGKVVGSRVSGVREEEIKKLIKTNLKHFTGKFKQAYPLYSSVNIKKVRAGQDVESTSNIVNVKSLKLIKIKTINNKKLLKDIEKRLGKVKGDFRQEEILKIWRKKLSNNSGVYTIASFRIECSSGTYVRAIANSLGERMKTPALAFKIKRTKVGKWGKM